MNRHSVIDSPVGPLTVVADGKALAGLYQSGQRHLPAATAFGARDDDVLPGVREQLSAYFSGDLMDFDLTLATAGTAFQAAVWAALQAIPYGATCTYGELAAAVGRPTAVRAVGAANGRNPICIVVPCHRVIGAGGALTGYTGGVERKRLLLALERRPAAP
jgi:methylated-DNA-[protein]-cysteine S-methyltransferase